MLSYNMSLLVNIAFLWATRKVIVDKSPNNNPIMREIPMNDRPRERLVNAGADALRNAELLAILFRTGTRELNAVALADSLLKAYDNDLLRLARATLEELQEIKGIGKVKAIEVRAALEIGMRMLKAKRNNGPRISQSRDVFELLRLELRAYETESFICLHLNAKNEVLKTEYISRGGMDWVNALPCDVMRQAVRNSTHAIIVVHNHPSGDPEPSESDVIVTKRLASAAELLGLRFLDHIIVGDERHVSLKERGLF